jgi:uncharacterized protein (DUF1330 family)
MPAYFFIKTKIHNRDEYMQYVAAVRPLAAKYGSRYLVRSTPVEMLEGDAEEWGDYLLLVSEFPDLETAKRFWHSDEYQAVRKLREAHGIVHVMLTQSLP